MLWSKPSIDKRWRTTHTKEKIFIKIIYSHKFSNKNVSKNLFSSISNRTIHNNSNKNKKLMKHFLVRIPTPLFKLFFGYDGWNLWHNDEDVKFHLTLILCCLQLNVCVSVYIFLSSMYWCIKKLFMCMNILAKNISYVSILAFVLLTWILLK